MRRVVFSLVVVWGGIVCPDAMGSTNVSGTIDTDTVWDANGSPYIVVGDVNIVPGVTLLAL